MIVQTLEQVLGTYRDDDGRYCSKEQYVGLQFLKIAGFKRPSPMMQQLAAAALALGVTLAIAGVKAATRRFA